MTALPTWAGNIVPVDMDGAAVLLGVSRRYLVDVLHDHPHFERRGVKKVFYPEHIARLREALCEQSHTQARGSSSGASTAFGTSLEPLPESAFEADGRSIGSVLVSEGLARPWSPGYVPHWCAQST